MKHYRDLSIIQKINFKSFAVANRFMRYGHDGFTPMWWPITTNGANGSVKLKSFEYERPYNERRSNKAMQSNFVWPMPQ